MDRREGEEVIFIVLLKVQERVTNLPDVYPSERDRCLLCVISLQTDSVLAVPDAVCCNGRMMAEPGSVSNKAGGKIQEKPT